MNNFRARSCRPLRNGKRRHLAVAHFSMPPAGHFARRPTTDPTNLYLHRHSLYAPELVAAAVVGLDFFSWLEKFPADLATICSSLGLAERPADVMLTLFCSMGYLEKKADTFYLTNVSRDFLVRGSPWFIGPYYMHMADRPICQGLLETLRTDKPGGWAEDMLDQTFAEGFTGTMDCRGLYVGPALAEQLDLAGRRRVLDIAGSSGIYACCIVATHPRMRATVFERPPVDRVAAKYIAERGFANRVDVLAGDMFRDPLPAGCDVHLWSNVLHDWDVPRVRCLLKKSFAALPSGGLVAIHDKHLNREKTGPLGIATHSVYLMARTEGRFYSMAEIETFLLEAGFRDPDYSEIVADYSIITARRP